MAFFVAFYSYKGGVGRTLALANVAHSLAERGKRVVLLDMDLEAPSLHDVPELALRGEDKKGLIEYASSYRKTGKLPGLRSYIHKCRRSPGSGELWLMPAGRIGSDYQQQLGDLAWRRLHPKQGTRPFVDGLRQALIDEIKPHYVLIDARTGLSDVGGLSTHLLADMVVLVFNLTPASIEGSVRAFRSFTSEGSRVRFVQLVASPVPPQGPGESLVETRIGQAAELMKEATLYGRNLIQIDYHQAMVLAEELAVRKPDRYPAAARYEMLRESIQRANPREVFPLVEQAIQLRSEGRLDEAIALLRAFTSSHPGDVEGHLALGNLLFEAGRYAEAGEEFRTASSLAPEIPLTHRRLGEALVAAKRPDEAVEALKKAADLGDRSRELYLAQARAYGQRNETALEFEARRKAMLAVLQGAKDLKPLTSFSPELRREFVEVLTRRPPYGGFQAEVFWDEVMRSLFLPLRGKLRVLRQTLNGALHPSDLRGLLQQFQEEKFRWVETLGPRAVELQQLVAENAVDPLDREALLTLREGSRTDSALLGLIAYHASSIIERATLLREAVEADPENTALLFALGATLGILADKTSSSSRKDYLLEECHKYKEALRYKPDHYRALLNWGASLLKLAEISEGEERNQLLQRAAALTRKASQIVPGAGDYNLACALSQLQDLDEAETLLRVELERSPEMRAHALQDPDLIPLWEARPDFRKEIEAQLPNSPTPASLSE